MYPVELTNPMADELRNNGFLSLSTEDEVIQAMENMEGTALIMVNSVCGCAAGHARPGVLMSLDNQEKVPTKLLTVFAGVDKEATNKARAYMLPYPASSPSIALFKDGKLVHFLERHHIEGANRDLISENLKMAYNRYC